MFRARSARPLRAGEAPPARPALAARADPRAAAAFAAPAGEDAGLWLAYNVSELLQLARPLLLALRAGCGCAHCRGAAQAFLLEGREAPGAEWAAAALARLEAAAAQLGAQGATARAARRCGREAFRLVYRAAAHALCWHPGMPGAPAVLRLVGLARALAELGGFFERRDYQCCAELFE